MPTLTLQRTTHPIPKATLSLATHIWARLYHKTPAMSMSSSDSDSDSDSSFPSEEDDILSTLLGIVALARKHRARNRNG